MTDPHEPEHKEPHPMTLADLLDRVDDAADLDTRTFDEIDADEARDAITSREVVFGLPARPSTVRR